MRRHFDQIRRLFFPRWKAGATWRLSNRSRRRVHGYCDPKRRVIEVVLRPDEPDERDRLIIHEICHAVADSGHGKKWQARMELAAKRADALGRRRLAQLLREEVEGYRRAPTGPEQAYQSVRDALLFNPDLTLRLVKLKLAYDYGLLLSEVGTKYFRRLDKVYEQARRDGLEERAINQEWQRRLKGQ